MTALHAIASAGAADAPQRNGRMTDPPSATPAAGDPTALIEWFIARVLARDPEFLRYGGNNSLAQPHGLVDYAFVTPQQPHGPDELFDRLRWGGQVIFLSRDKALAEDLAGQYQRFGGYVLERPVAPVRRGFMGLPFFSQTYYHFAARKILLVRPGQSSDRFSYHVELMRNPVDGQYIVKKQVPTFDRVVARLRERFPDEEAETIRRRAKKFTEKIFPVFLTREAAILQILHRDLPKAFRDRVPKVIAVEHDANKYVNTLYLKWLRNGGEPISQLRFARQSAELLAAVHDVAKVIHLDLRLDNMVITERGVGFVDFGSAVRVGEIFPESSLLCTLFEEMMRTSQIQRMLTRMTRKGLVTSKEITGCHHRVDKAVDFFYLAVQISAPHGNPDLKGLIRYEPDGEEAKRLKGLTDEILRPADPEASPYKSADDILHGLERIEQSLAAATKG